MQTNRKINNETRQAVGACSDSFFLPAAIFCLPFRTPCSLQTSPSSQEPHSQGNCLPKSCLFSSFPPSPAPGHLAVFGAAVGRGLVQQCSSVTPPVPSVQSHFSFCLLLLSQPLLMGLLAAADGDQVLLPTSRRCALTARRVIYFLFLLLNTPNSLNGAESN